MDQDGSTDHDLFRRSNSDPTGLDWNLLHREPAFADIKKGQVLSEWSWLEVDGLELK